MLLGEPKSDAATPFEFFDYFAILTTTTLLITPHDYYQKYRISLNRACSLSVSSHRDRKDEKKHDKARREIKIANKEQRDEQAMHNREDKISVKPETVNKKKNNIQNILFKKEYCK